MRKRKPAGHRKHFLYRASLAVETALVLPLFFLGVITMIGYMDIYKIQTEHLTNLCQNAKEAAMYAYSTAGSSADELIFPDSYSYKPISALVRMPAIWFQNQVKVRCWTGVSSTYFAARDSMVKMVFMAENGEVFHKNPSCSYLNVSVLQVSGKQIKSVKNQNGENYYACEICSRHQKPAGTVYVTGQGTRFHNRSNCSGLKRTILFVREDETKGVPCCSRCGG
ncbi:MAG: hypothetical protein Q4B47_01920 [Eubacteriales bacterium]|nr:hypothetical protein [Eubacteriales bacterium]